MIPSSSPPAPPSPQVLDRTRRILRTALWPRINPAAAAAAAAGGRGGGGGGDGGCVQLPKRPGDWKPFDTSFDQSFESMI